MVVEKILHDDIFFIFCVYIMNNKEFLGHTLIKFYPLVQSHSTCNTYLLHFEREIFWCHLEAETFH